MHGKGAFYRVLSSVVLMTLLVGSTPVVAAPPHVPATGVKPTSRRTLVGTPSLSTTLTAPTRSHTQGEPSALDEETDSHPPSAIANLTVSTGATPGSVDLSWIAPGDDGSTGTASAYVVRYNTTLVDESNWDTSSDVAGEPTPGPAGEVESMTVTGLAPGQLHYFAIRAQDEVSNTASISNSPSAPAQIGPNTTYLPLVASSPSEMSTAIPDTTVVLTDTVTEYLSAVSDDGSVLTFTQASRVEPVILATHLSASDLVIVSDVTAEAPYGLLRRVISVSSAGDRLVLKTKQATLEEAIQSGAAQVSHVLTPDQVLEGSEVEGVTLATAPHVQNAFSFDLYNVVLYDEDGNPYTTDDQVTADGTIRLEPSFDFSLLVRGFRLKELSFTTRANETADLHIGAQVEVPFIRMEKEIARYRFAPLTVWVGPVPVVIVPILTVNVGVDGSVHIGVSTEVTQQASLRAGVRYANRTWRPVRHVSHQFYHSPPTLSAGLTLKAYAGAQLSLMLYGVVGPYAEVDAYLLLRANPYAVPWWTLYGGLEVPVGVKVEVLGHSIAAYETVVFHRRLMLAEAQSNNRPLLPSRPSPADGAGYQSRDVDLSWRGGDPDGDAVTYHVYLEANDRTPDRRVAWHHGATSYDPGTLAPNRHYYWRIVAQDARGATNAGPVWDFTTGSGAAPTLLWGKTGNVVDHRWHRVRFWESFRQKPVVVAQIASERGGNNAHIDLKDVSRNGFTVRIEEDIGMDDWHKTEDVHWIAIRDGGASVLKAGRTGVAVAHQWHRVRFPAAFSRTPILMAQIMSEMGGDNADIDIKDVTRTGFTVRVEEDMSMDGGHTREEVGWVALMPGRHGEIQAGSTGVVVTDRWHTAAFPRSFSRTPVLLAQIVSERGGDNAHIDVKDVSRSRFKVRVEEDTEADGPHKQEEVHWIALQE